jgi:hypothetical protein
MTLPRPLTRAVVFVTALCVAVGIIEIGWRVVRTPAQEDDGRYLLFGTGGGSVFQNVGRFFLYQPHATVRTAAYFDDRGSVVKEYEYDFTTNNLGLVQRADVTPAVPSALILGDSFTEGQGAEPWFERLAPALSAGGYQPVNGGVLGTGFAQWILLHDYLIDRGIVIKKLVVVMISDDYDREVWNFPPPVLRCLADYRACAGDEEFYGMPPAAERTAFLARMSQHPSAATPGRWAARTWLPATTLAYGQARHLAANAIDWWHQDDRTARVRFFADRYGRDVIFVHLPTREELQHGIDPPGRAARAAIAAAGAAFFDGFTECGLTGSDYHRHDSHPTAEGYAKIAACVRKAAKRIM